MKSNSLKTIPKEIDILKTNFTNCRAYFPHIPEKLIGSRRLKTAPFYWNKGFAVTLSSSKPLTKKDIQRNNEIGHWINENVIVRLCAILESYAILSEKISIDHSIDGSKEVDLLRRLRNVIAHTSGRYNPNNPDHNKLLNELVSHFGLSNGNRKEFPLDIDKVIYPLFEACNRYVQGKISISQ